MAVQPQLFGPMLKRGDVDGTGGFTNSNIPAALELGFTLDDLFVIKYSDFGADMYGLALVTAKKFADENPAYGARASSRRSTRGPRTPSRRRKRRSNSSSRATRC